MYENRTLVRGDNLEEMRKFPDDCIDLIATDPPFNSQRNYFVPYRDQHGQEPDTLIRAFTDTWTWGEAVAQVKGENYTLGHIRDFRTAMQNVEADLGRFRRNNASNTRHANRSHTRRNIPIPILRLGNPSPTNLRDPKPFQRHSPKTPLRRKSRVVKNKIDTFLSQQRHMQARNSKTN